MHLLRLDDLVEQTLRARVDDPDVYDEPVDDLITIVDLDDGNRYVLDASGETGDGEYPMLDAFHEYGPSEWRTSAIAPSFEAWLRDACERVVDRGLSPWADSTQTLDQISMSAERHHRLALAAAAAGDVKEARRRFVRAFTLRRIGDEGGAECDLDALRAVAPVDRGDRFVRELLGRLVDTRRLACRRGTTFRWILQTAEQPPYVGPEIDFPLPWEYAALARDFMYADLFIRGINKATLGLSLSQVHIATRLGTPRRAVPIGTIQLPRPGGVAVLLDPDGAVWLFREPATWRYSALSDAPRMVASSLSEWLFSLFDRYATDGKPFGDDVPDELPPLPADDEPEVNVTLLRVDPDAPE